ncbi:MAG: rhomboid family intramembrane serine protease [Deinococcota bacterium]|jgi:membrane associated rhomboid family serine protease|nr:rhomboid family intramembrane serine protease [Deinococcota bacterium]
MIPLADASRRSVRFPVVTTLLIAANALVFMLELSLGDAFVGRWALVPTDITAGRGLITLLSAMFLHAGWLHILGNMLFLWVFGPPIEEAMGQGRYLAFYLLGGLAASFAQIVAAPGATLPNLGASGAIAAVMGAFLITYPADRIRTVLLLGWFVMIRLVPAALLVGLWFLIQLFSEFGALYGAQAGGVAYMAHLGGFVFGLVFARLFEAR